MLIEGSFHVEAPVREVWDFLVDIPRMSVCVPGVQHVTQTDENIFSGVVAVRLGAVRTRFEGRIVKTVEQAPERLEGQLTAWDAVTASLVTAQFSAHLRPDRQAAQVEYEVDVDIRGRLNQLSTQDVRERFQIMLDEFVRCARTRIERPPQLVLEKIPLLERLKRNWRAWRTGASPRQR